jgi:uncharacterized protein YciI
VSVSGSWPRPVSSLSECGREPARSTTSTTLKGNRIAGSTTDVAVVQYFNRLKEATDRGQVIVARRTAESLDKTFGIVVFEAKDQEAALEFMNADPAMHAGVMTAELHPFSVSLARKNPE